ncbi:MAG: peptidylprolyl isomerase [Deltaproteobacteria bacterium]|nr:peptidylprolyl isomerase [Deltaproteobacteria bacterium]
MRTLPILLALTFAACQPAAPERIPGDMPRDGVALETVNGKPVTQGMLDALLGTIPEATRKQLEEAGQIDRVKEELITTDALYQEALAKNLHKDAKVQTQLLMAERTVLVNHLVRTEVDARTTDEAMKKWYDEHLVQFRNEQVQAAHILAKTEEEAKAIKAELDGGADFGAVAAAKSQDTKTAPTGGVIGWLGKRELPPTLSQPLYAAEKGAVLDPIQSPSGWHVFKVMDKREVVPFEETKDQIKGKMQSEIAESYVKEIVEKSKAPAGATVTPAADGAAAPPAAPAAPAPTPGPLR